MTTTATAPTTTDIVSPPATPASTAPTAAPIAAATAATRARSPGMSRSPMVRPASREPHTAQVWKLAPESGPRTSSNATERWWCALVIARFALSGSAMPTTSSSHKRQSASVAARPGSDRRITRTVTRGAARPNAAPMPMGAS